MNCFSDINESVEETRLRIPDSIQQMFAETDTALVCTIACSLVPRPFPVFLR